MMQAFKPLRIVVSTMSPTRSSNRCECGLRATMRSVAAGTLGSAGSRMPIILRVKTLSKALLDPSVALARSIISPGVGDSASAALNNDTARVKIMVVCFIQGNSTGKESKGSHYSHSIVLGGFELISSTTRLQPSTSLIIRLDMLRSTSYGTRAQSAVMASTLSTMRNATTFS